MHGQCGILFIGPCGKDKARIAALHALGFRVDELPDVPPADTLAAYHAIVVRACGGLSLPATGTRLRGKPHFGRRVLIALVRDGVPDLECRDARLCGFDLTLADTCTPRDLSAHILRLLRGFPEYRCLLRSPNGRRKAA